MTTNSQSKDMLNRLISSDLSDIQRLIELKNNLDDRYRTNLEQRLDAIPGKAARSAIRAATAYKLNKNDERQHETENKI